jgi:hypothetical protein
MAAILILRNRPEGRIIGVAVVVFSCSGLSKSANCDRAATGFSAQTN